MKMRFAANGTKPFTAEDAEDAEKFVQKTRDIAHRGRLCRTNPRSFGRVSPRWRKHAGPTLAQDDAVRVLSGCSRHRTAEDGCATQAQDPSVGFPRAGESARVPPSLRMTPFVFCLGAHYI